MNFLSSVQVIRGLLKFWPKTCSQKEVICQSVATLSAVSWQLILPLASLCLSIGHVPGGSRGDSRRHRAVAVQENPGAAV